MRSKFEKFVEFLSKETHLFYAVNSYERAFPDEAHFDDFLMSVRELPTYRAADGRSRKLETVKKIFFTGGPLDLSDQSALTQKNLKPVLEGLAAKVISKFNTLNPKSILSYREIRVGLENGMLKQVIDATSTDERQQRLFNTRIESVIEFLNDSLEESMAANDGPHTQGKHIPNYIFYGPPGTGKTFEANQIGERDGWQVSSIQFHPSYSYEQFVQGERLVNIGKERTTQIVDGFLMMAFRKATNCFAKSKCTARLDGVNLQFTFPSGLLSKYGITKVEEIEISIGGEKSVELKCLSLVADRLVVSKPAKIGFNFENGEVVELLFRSRSWAEMKPQLIIIDEINRADVQRVFGELMNAMSEANNPNSKKDVMLQYSGEKFFWPPNMRIIATMNSADRSISEIDQAMKRRFHLKKYPANPERLSGSLPPTLLKIGNVTLQDKFAHELDPAEISKKFKSYGQAFDSCDSFIRFFRECVQVHGLDKKYLIPIPSESLGRLHDALKDGAKQFATERRLPGHTFHMEFVRSAGLIISGLLDAGFPLKKEAVAKAAQEVRIIYREMVEFELRPQVESICMDSEELIEDVLQSWEEADAEEKVDSNTDSVQRSASGE